MTPEKPQFPEDAESPKKPMELLSEALAAAEAERRKEQKDYLVELAHVIDWIGGMLSRHGVGKDPGRHLDLFSPLGDLIEFGERDADEETKRHNYEEANKATAMVGRLKDKTFVPPEAITIGELHNALYDQLIQGKKNLDAIKKQSQK